MSKPVAPAALAAVLGNAISRFSRRQRQARPVGELTQNQISVLTSLELGGPLTPRELADAERVQPPTITKILARLEDRGLLQRTPHPTDGRQVLLSPTPAGHDIVAEQRRAKDEWLTRALSGLSPAQRQILCQAAEIMARIAREGD